MADRSAAVDAWAKRRLDLAAAIAAARKEAVVADRHGDRETATRLRALCEEGEAKLTGGHHG